MTHEDHRFCKSKRRHGQDHHRDQRGRCLARLGKRVLIADLDPQGHAAVSMNLDTEPCVANWLMYPIFNNQPITPEVMNQWIRPTRHENLFLLPGNQMTAKAQRLLAIEEQPINYIKDMPAAIRKLGFRLPALRHIRPPPAACRRWHPGRRTWR
jgi:septum formation inhibitor-activating ATPase MinD